MANMVNIMSAKYQDVSMLAAYSRAACVALTCVSVQLKKEIPDKEASPFSEANMNT